MPSWNRFEKGMVSFQESWGCILSSLSASMFWPRQCFLDAEEHIFFFPRAFLCCLVDCTELPHLFSRAVFSKVFWGKEFKDRAYDLSNVTLLVDNKWRLGPVDTRQNHSITACGSGASLNLHLQNVQANPQMARKQVRIQVSLAPAYKANLLLSRKPSQHKHTSVPAPQPQLGPHLHGMPGRPK